MSGSRSCQDQLLGLGVEDRWYLVPSFLSSCGGFLFLKFVGFFSSSFFLGWFVIAFAGFFVVVMAAELFV